MSTRHEGIDKSVLHAPAKKPYTSPLLTRYGTVEELTQTDGTTHGSGLPSDATGGG